MNKKTFGAYGEDLAGRYLESRGYRVVARRWRVRQGEIDLIVRKGDEVLFIEVKSRRSSVFGTPEESITEVKASRLRTAVFMWLSEYGADVVNFRIDVITLYANNDATWKLRHIRGAIEGI